MSKLMFAGTALLLLLATAPLSAQTWDETANGGGDAGDLPATFQGVYGTGALTNITGNISSSTDRDVYRIRIANAANFSANTNTTPLGTNADTQLRLFTLAGIGIAYNDDISSTNFRSDLPVGNALYSGLAAGEYLLVISGWNQRANSSTGDIFPNTFLGVFGPTGAGGTNPLSAWSGTNTTGTYNIVLTGCEYATVPPAPVVNVLSPVSTSIANGGTYSHDTPLLGGSAGPGLQFTIQNTGGSTMTISGTPITGTSVNCSPSITAPAGPSVGSGSFTTVTFSVNPAAGVGSWSFQFTINSNATVPSYVVNVQGTRGLTGTLTVNSTGGTPDFSDLGAAFDALETNGVAGAVTLSLTGNFTSAANYGLGHTGTTLIPIRGISATNTISIVAAAGQSPTISGSGATDIFGAGLTATISIFSSFVSIEGLTITGGTDACLVLLGNAQTGQGLAVRRCRIHSGSGSAILAVGLGGNNLVNFLLENCMFWGCDGSGGFASLATGLDGLVLVGNSTGLVARHNSILHNVGTGGTPAVRLFDGFTGAAIAEFTNNIVQTTSSGCPAIGIAVGSEPATCNHNLYEYAAGGFHIAPATYPNFAAWQTATRDANGIDGNPAFVSTAAGSEDLHINNNSQARNAGSSSTTTDIDGDTRPQGSSVDIGADEYREPEIEIFDAPTGGTSLTDPATISGVNVGPTATVLTFRIENQASAPGNLILPSNPVTFNVTTGTGTVNVAIGQPASLNLAPGQSTTFTVSINSTASATGNNYVVEVDVASNDFDENPFDINIGGTATFNNPPVANPETTTSSPVFTGTADVGPFSFAANPGTAVNSRLIVTDPDTGNQVRIVSISVGAQAGVTPSATIGSFAASQNVDFTGTVDPGAVPGVYSWSIEIEDNQTPAGTRTIQVNITVNNIAPDPFNQPVAPTTGAGTSISVYARSFQQTQTVTGADLFNVTDANTGQAIVITAPSQVRTGGTATGNPFDGNFTATFISPGNYLVEVSSTGALGATAVGTHEYQLVISDGTASVTVHVTLTVTAQTPPTFTPNATGVSIGQGGVMTNVDVGTVADAQDPLASLNVTATNVPAGITVSAISVNTTTGVVTCTITVGAAVTPGSTVIEFTVTDPASLTDADNYTFTVTANNLPTITAGTAITMGQSANLTGRTIATVSDADQAAGTLTVAATVVPPGITISNITNTTGTVTADVSSSSTIAAGTYNVTLQVTDAEGATATDTLQITISTGGGGGGGGGGGKKKGGGCSADNNTATGWMALAAMLGVITLAVRRRRVNG